MPASNCALELPEGAPGAFIPDVVVPEPPLEPQPVSPKTANATRSAPAVSLSDLEVVCIFSSFPVYETGEEDFTAVGLGLWPNRSNFPVVIGIVFRNITISASSNSPLAYAAAWPLEKL